MVMSIELEKKQIRFDEQYQTFATLHAAGSLKMALSEVTQTFSSEYKIPVRLEFDHSGLLRERLENGEHSDIFASADIKQPTTLMKSSISGPVVNFVRNKMCAIVKPGLGVTSNNLLDLMLSPEIKLGTSTPNQDASGDYAQKIFRKANKLRPGSFEKLNQKAIHLIGGRNSPLIPEGKHQLAYFLAETQQVDIFLCYRTAVHLALRAAPNLQMIELPRNLAIKANYGMTMMKNASSSGMMLAMYILSSSGQRILAKYGFDSPLFRENIG